MNPLPLIYSVVMVLLLFGGTVLVHELGHFMTAKWFKLRIDAFSIGMGPAIWQKKIKGVVYKLSWLPIGGYVALPQMDITGSAFENDDAKQGKLEPVEPWKRIIIAVAGPVMNVITAFLLCVIVWAVGKPYDAGPGPAEVGRVHRNSPAYEAGLRAGDLITHVNGDRVLFWTDVDIASSLNEQVQLRIVRDGEWKELPAVPTIRNRIGFLQLPGVRPVEHVEYVRVGGLQKDSPADRAGLLPGDILKEVNGEPVGNSDAFILAVQSSDGRPLELGILRGEAREPLEITLVPEFHADVERYLIGVFMDEVHAEVTIHPNPVTQLQYFSGSIFRTLRAFGRPRERREASQGIGGPVIMLGSIHSQVQTSFMQALWFTALINVNLAIINLLPFIVLDGGHILVSVYEIVFRKPPHRKVIIALANTMVVLLISLMITLTFRDVLLMRRIHQELNGDEAQAEQTPTPEPAEDAGDED
ncbi:MAG: RIP metalloprotease RseP [Verrucomicrobia bacterium]|nr:RIP metalloprotease RseP [Verrucomicrobiota bacterium]MCH8526744.1 RIP metalloprotease RseP [Kiritimatiellia bacterium]